jgi:DNA-binding response OmpR family regulator
MKGELQFETVPVAEIMVRGLSTETGHQRPVALIVDDEPVITDTLAAILNHHGFSVLSAYSGDAALELAKVIPPEVLISDVVMPGIGGMDLAVAIREAIPDCKVLLFSGQASTLDLMSSAQEAGYDFSVLLKPIHPMELLDHLSKMGVTPQSQDHL